MSEPFGGPLQVAGRGGLQSCPVPFVTADGVAESTVCGQVELVTQGPQVRRGAGVGHRGGARDPSQTVVQAGRHRLEPPSGEPFESDGLLFQCGFGGGDQADQVLGDRGRGLQRGVGDLVGDTAVDLVADPGEHRHRCPGDRVRDVGVIEGDQVGA